MQTDTTSTNPAGDEFLQNWCEFLNSYEPDKIYSVLNQIALLKGKEGSEEYIKIQLIVEVLYSWKNTDDLSDLKCSWIVQSGTNFIDHLSPINKKMFEMLGKLLAHCQINPTDTNGLSDEIKLIFTKIQSLMALSQ